MICISCKQELEVDRIFVEGFYTENMFFCNNNEGCPRYGLYTAVIGDEDE